MYSPYSYGVSEAGRVGVNRSGTYGERIRGIRNQETGLISGHSKVSWRFKEMKHDCPGIYSPFQPHHHQQQHLCEWRNDTQKCQRSVRTGRNRGGAGSGAWGDLHLMACISLTGFQHNTAREWGGSRIRFGILKARGWYRFKEQAGRRQGGPKER